MIDAKNLLLAIANQCGIDEDGELDPRWFAVKELAETLEGHQISVGAVIDSKEYYFASFNDDHDGLFFSFFDDDEVVDSIEAGRGG
jgi:hypothetical protein